MGKHQSGISQISNYAFYRMIKTTETCISSKVEVCRSAVKTSVETALTTSKAAATAIVTCPTPCNPNPCQNDGYCTTDGIDFTCECKQTHQGTLCEEGELERPGYFFPNKVSNLSKIHVVRLSLKCPYGHQLKVTIMSETIYNYV